MSKEKPLLINPVNDDPSEHLDADLRTGMITAKTQRGSTCIDLFALNLRDRLPEERLKAVDQVKAMVQNLIDGDPAAKKRARRQLKDIRSGKTTYALFARRALETMLDELGI
ncbi:MAG: hypothetical protein QNK37_27235 [Acidobacteriota bacterium]|nr:hypothetical protein [Acidobacteriota bacterium]